MFNSYCVVAVTKKTITCLISFTAFTAGGIRDNAQWCIVMQTALQSVAGLTKTDTGWAGTSKTCKPWARHSKSHVLCAEPQPTAPPTQAMCSGNDFRYIPRA